jgi:hypothetical protein
VNDKKELLSFSPKVKSKSLSMKLLLISKGVFWRLKVKEKIYY